MKNTAFSAHISLQLAKHHRVTLIKCNKTRKEKPMKMAKFCEDHAGADLGVVKPVTRLT